MTTWETVLTYQYANTCCVFSSISLRVLFCILFTERSRECGGTILLLGKRIPQSLQWESWTDEDVDIALILVGSTVESSEMIIKCI